MDFIDNLFGYLTPGAFLYIDLLAAFTNALNGALLVQRPDHYKGRFITVIGILVFAIFGGIGGGITRDVLLNEAPGSLTNPWYLILIVVAWIIGLLTAWSKGMQFRETYYQFMTSFSLPWYAMVGVEKGLEAEWPFLGAIFLGVVGPTAGRFLIDVICRLRYRLCLPRRRHLVPVGGTDAQENSRLAAQRPAQARIPQGKNAAWLDTFLGTT